VKAIHLRFLHAVRAQQGQQTEVEEEVEEEVVVEAEAEAEVEVGAAWDQELEVSLSGE